MTQKLVQEALDHCSISGFMGILRVITHVCTELLAIQDGFIEIPVSPAQLGLERRQNVVNS
jgi:hypothetical protein